MERRGVFVLCAGLAFNWEGLGDMEGDGVSNCVDVLGLFLTVCTCQVHGEGTAHAKAACECGGGTGAPAATRSGSPGALSVDGDEDAVDLVGGGDVVVGVLLGED